MGQENQRRSEESIPGRLVGGNILNTEYSQHKSNVLRPSVKTFKGSL